MCMSPYQSEHGGVGQNASENPADVGFSKFCTSGVLSRLDFRLDQMLGISSSVQVFIVFVSLLCLRVLCGLVDVEALFKGIYFPE